MSKPRWASAFSPFAIRSYRYQWAGDLLTSWAFEMETVLLGWYIVVQTKSVLLVTLFGAMQFLGTLVAPLLGLAGDKFGQRNVLCLMRSIFVVLSVAGALLTLIDALTPTRVLLIAALGGLVRPADTGIRNVLVAENVPAASLMQAIPLSRITMDGARAAGALCSGIIVLVLGMSVAYPAVVLFYALGVLFTLGVTDVRASNLGNRAKVSPWRDLRDAAQAIVSARPQLAALIIAFIVNVTAYPFTLGLLPYIARDVYATTQVGLGYMVAAVAGGGVLGSLILGVMVQAVRPARTVLTWSLIWHGLIITFGQTRSLFSGILVLALIGVAQMLCILPMAVLLLRGAPPELRGRIMGMRTLAVYGLPLGLLCSGPLIDWLGLPTTSACYGALGCIATVLVVAAWHAELWPADAVANAV